MATKTHVTTDTTQTLSNKTLDNTSTANIKDSNLVIQDNADATKQVRFEASGVTAGQTRVLTVPDFDGTVVTAAGAQVLTNKDIDGGTASNTNRITIPKDTLANLQALTRKEATILYATDTDKFYYDNGSTLTPIGSGGSGAKSYATEDDSTADNLLGPGWTTFNDGAYPPVDGSGGTVTATFARTTSSPLQGAGSMLLTPGVQYDGIVFEFTIDRADFARMHKIEFDYEIGTYTSYTDGDVKLAVISASDSGFTTDLQVTQPAGHSIMKVAGQETHVATFQSHASNLYYRVCAVQTTASTGYTLKIDNFKVGPQSVAYGAPVSDIKAYTPTWSASTPPAIGNGTIQGWWSRRGDTMDINIDVITGTTTTYGTGAWTFSLPSGYSIDTTKVGSQFAAVLGKAQAHVTVSSNIYDGIVYRNDSTSVTVFTTGGTAATSWQNTSPASWSGSTANQRIGLKFSVPILGWSSSLVVSDSASTRVVSFRGANGSTQSLTAGTTKIAVTTVRDSHAAWDGDEYVVSVPGDYFCTLKSGDNSGTTVGFDVYVDGSNYGRIHNSYATSAGENGSGSILIPGLLAGQRIDFRCNSSITAAPTSISVFRISGPAQIAASEIITARYYATGSTSTTNATPTIINFDTKGKDSHGSVTTGASWKFTAQKPCEVLVSTMIGFAINATGIRLLQLYKNGSLFANLDRKNSASGSGEEFVGGQTKVQMLAGDYIDVRGYQTSGGSLNVGVDQYTTYIDIVEVGNY